MLNYDEKLEVLRLTGHVDVGPTITEMTSYRADLWSWDGTYHCTGWGTVPVESIEDLYNSLMRIVWEKCIEIEKYG